MDKPLTPETQSQIRALCESIAQRDQLGEDVQEELRGHIEDRSHTSTAMKSSLKRTFILASNIW